MTLKDLEQGEHTIFTKTEPKIYYVNTNDLRQEAIKDIKEYEYRITLVKRIEGIVDLLSTVFTTKKQLEKERNIIKLQAYIDYIKWKFNITEEDLK